MLLHIPDVLNQEQLADMRRVLDGATWNDGAATAGPQAANAKHNRQLPGDSSLSLRLGEVVSNALQRHPMFVSAVLPKRVLPPLFNRYEGGGHYGNHVDSAIQRDPMRAENVRTDVSITVFLSAPDEYDGGELIIEDSYGAHEVKLPAGDAIVYPATSLHRVEAVTRGVRLASFLWAQSMVSNDGRRRMLFELDMTIVKLRAQLGDNAEVVALTGHYHNLLRQWAVL